MNSITIKTERLVLRPLSLADLETTHAYAGDVDNTQYMLNLPNAEKIYTEKFLRIADAEWKKEMQSRFEFAVTLGGEHIGAISLSLENGRTVGSIGWIINKCYQNNGYATEAAMALIKYVFKTLGVKKIISICDQRNKASERIMQKIGMMLEDDTGTRTYKSTGETAPEYKYSISKI